MNDSKDHKAAAEPPLDCRVGRCFTATANKPRGQVWIWTGRGFRVMTEKDAAIDEIRAQPFYAPNASGKPTTEAAKPL